mgnify:FL=1|tara:strand:+ start:236 stop:472 length:237 start_codon:yes stop_codon:yes gene_type:complete
MRKPHKQTKIHSQLHRFLNEEGLSNVMIADILNLSTSNSISLKKYMMNPKKLRIENIYNICDYTDVSFDFVISIIEDN